MDLIIIVCAGFFAGMLNAIAGGGSFITLPALILIGVPSVTANATGTAALLPGYISSAWRFRKDIEYPANLDFKTIALICSVGGCLGAVILLATNEQLFSKLIPWLILFATLSFVIGPWLIQRKSQLTTNTQHNAKVGLKKSTAVLMFLCVCIYGGYFNGGLGIIVLAALGFMGQTNLHGMNGLKNIISVILTAIAVLVYAAGGQISTEQLIPLSIAAVVGGYTGAAVSYRIPQQVLRITIIVIGCFMSAAFFVTKA